MCVEQSLEWHMKLSSATAATADLALVGIQTGGVWVVEALAVEMLRIEAAENRGANPIVVGSVDASLYRDDIGMRPVSPGSVSDLAFTVEGVTVVLVDDVLYTGRTVRAAIDAIGDYGRPKAVQLAAIVDRGHRELPIRPDFVGKNLPTSAEESVSVTPNGVTITQRTDR